ncbi:hypothetical protein [Allochromatium palmeri]|uniref:Uncharacterized protein n=1 Tax=Allochromatium palmeri TaxID=231048 RepID=A0A6N8EAP9_9GAMM|nr:hypothetical protein [Allochromatium palmeri]MTW19607.1 hypothetical protein [Allochromatium palmeri]
MNLDFNPFQRRSAPRLAAALVCVLVSGCGDQVVVEGVDLNDNDALVGDSVLDTQIDATGMSGAEANATGDPYEAAIEGEPNLGPNAPGYIP